MMMRGQGQTTTTTTTTKQTNKQTNKQKPAIPLDRPKTAPNEENVRLCILQETSSKLALSLKKCA